MKTLLPVVACLYAVVSSLHAQPQAESAPSALSPAELPGAGLKQHDFVYAGEWDTRKPDAQSLTIVRNGNIVWSIHIPLRTSTGGAQEFDDATLLPNGNLVFARMSGAALITPGKRVLWEYLAPKGCECHSIQPVGKDLVLIARNGPAPAALIFNTATNSVVKEISVPTKTTKSHGQFRHIRMTHNGTVMVPLLTEGKVIELDLEGHVLWSVDAKSPWSAVPLRNGNILIAGDAARYVREVNREGKSVWDLTQADVPGIRLFNTQTASRLENGNTVICSWVAGNPRVEEWPHTVQVLEVSPNRKVVWALRSWTGAEDLGPATHIQILDQPDAHDIPNFQP